MAASEYCTEANLVDKYGASDLAQLTDYDRDGAADSDSVTQSIRSMSSYIDSYAEVLYAIPFAPIPQVIRDCCKALVWCDLLSGRDSLTETAEKECKHWTKWLELLAAGKVTPGIAPIPGASAGAPQVAYDCDDRVFGRDYPL